MDVELDDAERPAAVPERSTADWRQGSTMVLIIDGYSEISAHVSWNHSYLIWLRY